MHCDHPAAVSTMGKALRRERSVFRSKNNGIVRGGLRKDARLDLSEESLIQPLNEAVKLAESMSGVGEVIGCGDRMKVMAEFAEIPLAKRLESREDLLTPASMLGTRLINDTCLFLDAYLNSGIRSFCLDDATAQLVRNEYVNKLMHRDKHHNAADLKLTHVSVPRM